MSLRERFDEMYEETRAYLERHLGRDRGRIIAEGWWKEVFERYFPPMREPDPSLLHEYGRATNDIKGIIGGRESHAYVFGPLFFGLFNSHLPSWLTELGQKQGLDVDELVKAATVQCDGYRKNVLDSANYRMRLSDLFERMPHLGVHKLAFINEIEVETLGVIEHIKGNFEHIAHNVDLSIAEKVHELRDYGIAMRSKSHPYDGIDMAIYSVIHSGQNDNLEQKVVHLVCLTVVDYGIKRQYGPNPNDLRSYQYRPR